MPFVIDRTLRSKEMPLQNTVVINLPFSLAQEEEEAKRLVTKKWFTKSFMFFSLDLR